MSEDTLLGCLPALFVCISSFLHLLLFYHSFWLIFFKSVGASKQCSITFNILVYFFFFTSKASVRIENLCLALLRGLLSQLLNAFFSYLHIPWMSFSNLKLIITWIIICIPLAQTSVVNQMKYLELIVSIALVLEMTN